MGNCSIDPEPSYERVSWNSTTALVESVNDSV